MAADFLLFDDDRLAGVFFFVLLLLVLVADLRLMLAFFFGASGTLAPSFRALANPMAIACSRDSAFPFLPLRCLPRFCLCKAFPTSSLAILLYLRLFLATVSLLQR